MPPLANVAERRLSRASLSAFLFRIQYASSWYFGGSFVRLHRGRSSCAVRLHWDGRPRPVWLHRRCLLDRWLFRLLPTNWLRRPRWYRSECFRYGRRRSLYRFTSRFWCLRLRFSETQVPAWMLQTITSAAVQPGQVTRTSACIRIMRTPPAPHSTSFHGKLRRSTTG